VAALKFPCRAFLFDCARLLLPTRNKGVLSSSLIDQQEKNLPLDMTGYCTPALFIAVYCLEGGSKEFSHFFLSFIKLFSRITEFFFGQGAPLNVLVFTGYFPKKFILFRQ